MMLPAELLFVLLVLACLAALIACVPLVRGPAPADRMLGLLALLFNLVGVVVVAALWQGQPALLDALLGAVVAGGALLLGCAHYLERSRH